MPDPDARQRAWEAYYAKEGYFDDEVQYNAFHAGWVAATAVAVREFDRAVIERYTRAIQDQGPRSPASDYLIALQDAIDAELAARGIERDGDGAGEEGEQ